MKKEKKTVQSLSSTPFMHCACVRRRFEGKEFIPITFFQSCRKSEIRHTQVATFFLRKKRPQLYSLKIKLLFIPYSNRNVKYQNQPILYNYAEQCTQVPTWARAPAVDRCSWCAGAARPALACPRPPPPPVPSRRNRRRRTRAPWATGAVATAPAGPGPSRCPAGARWAPGPGRRTDRSGTPAGSGSRRSGFYGGEKCAFCLIFSENFGAVKYALSYNTWFAEEDTTSQSDSTVEYLQHSGRIMHIWAVSIQVSFGHAWKSSIRILTKYSYQTVHVFSWIFRPIFRLIHHFEGGGGAPWTTENHTQVKSFITTR